MDNSLTVPRRITVNMNGNALGSKALYAPYLRSCQGCLGAAFVGPCSKLSMKYRTMFAFRAEK